jgi:hypothetical protein
MRKFLVMIMALTILPLVAGPRSAMAHHKLKEHIAKCKEEHRHKKTMKKAHHAACKPEKHHNLLHHHKK